MNPDMDKIERFVLGRFTHKVENPEGRLQLGGGFFVAVAVIFLIVTYNRLSWFEAIGIYHSGVIVTVLILLALILGVATAKITLRVSDCVPKPIGVWGGIAIFLGMFLGSRVRNLPRDTEELVMSFVIAIGSLVFAYIGIFILYKVYLIRKHAPYFKDMRLRRDK